MFKSLSKYDGVINSKNPFSLQNVEEIHIILSLLVEFWSGEALLHGFPRITEQERWLHLLNASFYEILIISSNIFHDYIGKKRNGRRQEK